MPPQEGEQVTRARCAECGSLLATERSFTGDDVELLVHPCGACLQEARADAIAACQQANEELECPLDTCRERLAEGKLLIDEGRD